MRKSHSYAMLSVEKYLRYGVKDSSIVTKNNAEQKTDLMPECERVLTEFRNANLDHIDATRKVFQLQNDMKKILFDIENKLADIVAPENSEVFKVIIRIIPFIRRLRKTQSNREFISAGSGILGSLIKISDLYTPVRKATAKYAKMQDEQIFWSKKMIRRGRRKDRFYLQYRNMACPIGILQRFVDEDERK